MPFADVLHLLNGFSASHAYFLLFLGVLLENAGIPLPGETALLAAGFLASPAGDAHLHLWAVIAVAFTAAVIGDNLGYWAGRELGRTRLAHGQRFLFLTPGRFRKAEWYFEHYGVMTVFFGRFVALLRIVAGPAAGVAGMPWGRFVLANAAGAAVWAAVIATLGYLAGPAWTVLQVWLGRCAWLAVGAVVLAVIAWRFAHYVRIRRESRAADLAARSIH